MSTITHDNPDQDWRIARVADASLARRCIGRLDACGMDYQVVADNQGKSTILVRRNQLSDVVELLDDLELHVGGMNRQSVPEMDHRQQLGLLTGMPLGGGIGLALSALLGIPYSYGTVLPAICAGLMGIVIAAFCRPRHVPPMNAWDARGR